jgi:hypothetical protein
VFLLDVGQLENGRAYCGAIHQAQVTLHPRQYYRAELGRYLGRSGGTTRNYEKDGLADVAVEGQDKVTRVIERVSDWPDEIPEYWWLEDKKGRKGSPTPENARRMLAATGGGPLFLKQRDANHYSGPSEAGRRRNTTGQK